MKRSKNDHIRSLINRYFKRRQFLESEMPSRKDPSTSKRQSLRELSVRRRSQTRSSTSNTTVLSSITGDANSFEQQFNKLKIHVLGAVEPYKDQLELFLHPMFIHVYLEMICNGHKLPAHKFHERNWETVSCTDGERAFLKSLRRIESKADIFSNKEVLSYRDSRRYLSMNSDCLDYLMRFLKEDDKMLLLQIFNQFISIQVSEKSNDTNGNHIEMRTLPDVKEEKEEVKVKLEAMEVEESGDTNVLKNLTSAIENLKSVSPPLPSICFYTLMNTCEGLCSCAISDDKGKLSSGFEDSSVQVWSLEGENLNLEESQCDISQVMIAADFHFSTEAEMHARFHTRRRQRQRDECIKLMGHRGSVYQTKFLSDSSTHLLSCSEDTSVRLWHLPSRSNKVIYQGHSFPVWDLSVSSTDSWFASCSHDTTAKLWSFDRTFPLRSYVGHSQDVDCVEFHANNNYIATGSSDKTSRLWTLSDARSVRLFQGHRGSVLALAFSPDGKLLATAGEDRRVRVWDLGSGQALKELRGHSDVVYSLAFNKQSSVLASGGSDCTVRLWDVKKGNDSHLNEGHSSPELLAAYPSKSAVLSHLSFDQYNILLAAGASS